MRFIKYVVIALLVATLSATTSISIYAQEWGGKNINARQRHQESRIRQGVRNGELTRHETARLKVRSASIRAQENCYRRSGGQFTARERARVQHRLNHLNRDIYRQKHDRQSRR